MSLVQYYGGRSRYAPDVPFMGQLMFVSVTCRLGPLPDRFDALLDNAAQWCVLTPKIANDLGLLPLENSGTMQLHTRLGTFRGELMRVDTKFPAIEGEQLPIEATWFVSSDWPGPLVIGWKGCLERLRFALDPPDESFYFGEPYHDKTQRTPST